MATLCCLWFAFLLFVSLIRLVFCFLLELWYFARLFCWFLPKFSSKSKATYVLLAADIHCCSYYFYFSIVLFLNFLFRFFFQFNFFIYINTFFVAFFSIYFWFLNFLFRFCFLIFFLWVFYTLTLICDPAAASAFFFAGCSALFILDFLLLYCIISALLAATHLFHVRKT